MEVLSIRLKATKSTWLELCNVFLPNTTTQQNSFDPSLIKPSLTSIILGDFNGHSQLLNLFQPPNSYGDKILDQVRDNDLHIFNATRTIRITGNESTPDIWSAKISWKLAETIGSSNHLSIVIEILLPAPHPEDCQMAT